jgi:hypothetical protein
LPIIKVNTQGNLSDERKTLAEVQIIDSDEGKNDWSDVPTAQLRAKIKIRGSSSKLLPKQSYLLKTYNDSLK